MARNPLQSFLFIGSRASLGFLTSWNGRAQRDRKKTNTMLRFEAYSFPPLHTEPSIPDPTNRANHYRNLCTVWCLLHVVVFLRRDSFVGRTFLLSMHHLSLSGEETGRLLELHEMAKKKQQSRRLELGVEKFCGSSHLAPTPCWLLLLVADSRNQVRCGGDANSFSCT